MQRVPEVNERQLLTDGFTDPPAWCRQGGWRRQALSRREALMQWLNSNSDHQGLSAQDIAERCPLYAPVRDRYRGVLVDLNVIVARGR